MPESLFSGICEICPLREIGDGVEEILGSVTIRNYVRRGLYADTELVEGSLIEGIILKPETVNSIKGCLMLEKTAQCKYTEE